MSPVAPRQEPSPELKELRRRIRHSTAHIMADAVSQLFPEAKLAIGPPTEDGFYYDFDVPRPFTPEDLGRIEALMRERIAADLPFVRREVGRHEAASLFQDQPYKDEILRAIPEGEPVSTFRHGSFEDLCEGPHVERTGQVTAFKLLSVAGAYWRGDSSNPMLQRIYGAAFEGGEALEEHLHRLEEAIRRDHRRLGRELGLFTFDPLAPASPFFLPKGTILFNLLVEYIRGLYRRYGYQEVITPQIFLSDLWKRSGHYDNYKDEMYFVTAEERELGVKPMNCPAHALLFASQLRSYRELPLRIADFGRLHRFELSGVTHGLTRVRTFTQDDAHIFCAEEQIEAEVRGFIAMLLESYRVFGFDEPRIMLSLRPEKRVGPDAMWDRAEGILERVLAGAGHRFEATHGEGAFYGPKIDFFVPDALGREWQLGTIQLDFSLPERFGLEYVAEDGSARRPAVLHRALLGTLERFIGVLIEHHAGAFPLWLAPVQAVVIPIADRHVEYARKVRERLAAHGLRVDVDARSERMNAKIRDAQLQKVPYMLVVGNRESADGAAAVRLRDGMDLGPLPVGDIAARMLGEVAERG